MVATRKPPAIPPAPLSRSSSTQPLPTKRQANKPNPLDLGPTPQKPSSTPNAARKPSAGSKTLKPHRRRSLVDRLFLLSLFLFAGYSFLLCRTNSYFSNPDAPEPLLCRSLAMYRTKVLEPYVIPPIARTVQFSHKLAQPYIEKGKEHVKPYVAPISNSFHAVRPHVARVQHTASDIWHDSLVPFFQHTVRPWWNGSVLPRWERYAKPYVVPFQHRAAFYWRYYISNPIYHQYAAARSFANAIYLKHIHPIALATQPHVAHLAQNAQAAVARTAGFYSSYVRPTLTQTWKAVRPYLCQLLGFARQAVSYVIDFISVQGRKSVQILGQYRRTYVDPHLVRIWERAAERNTSAVSAADSLDAETTAASVAEPTPAAIVETDATPIPLTPEPSQEHTADASVPSPQETAGDEVSEQLPINSQVEQEHEHLVEEAARAISVAEESAHGASSAVHELEREIEATFGIEPESITADTTPSLTSTYTPSPTPDHVDAPAPQPEEKIPVDPEQNTLAAESEPATPPPPGPTAAPSIPGGVSAEAIRSEVADEDDLDDFLKDLGVDPSGNAPVPVEDPEPEPEPTPEVPQGESEEAKAARLAETAAKRKEITTRHAKWQTRLDETCIEEGQKLVSTLERSRAQVVPELDKLGWGKTSPEEKRSEKGGILAEVQNEGARLLKGLETFLKKAEARSDTWKLAEGDSDSVKETKKTRSKEEKSLWTSVAGKVQDKLDEKVESVRSRVFEWYTTVQNAELQEALDASLVIKHIAEEAQADLSLDYAWLDDVTYQDWQRFHDLMRTYDRFAETVTAIQNGTSVDPPSPPDAVMDGLDALHADLEDAVVGFQVAFASVKSRASELFSVFNIADEDDGFFVVNDGQVRKDDLRGVDLGSIGVKVGEGKVKVGDKEKEVHILPIKDEEPPIMIGDPAFDASQVIIGKSAAQVEEALKNAPPVEDVRSRHEEL